jgi:IclR family transcriptional regulator, acetate operon repressor
VVGSAFVRSRDVVAIARPYMRQLMEESGETVKLATRERGRGGVPGTSGVPRNDAREPPPWRAKMHCSGVGKAILAWLPAARIKEILHCHGMPPATERTLTSPNGLRDELKRVRERGFAIDDEEHAVGCAAWPPRS